MRRWIFLLSAPLLLGCANRALVRFDAITREASSQEYLTAIDQIRRDRSTLYGSQSALLYHMDLGLLYHYADLYDSSIVFLENAVKVHDDLYTHSVTNEAAALLTNDNTRPYRGKSYEIAWLHLFLALDYLALEHLDDARVEVRQAQIFLDEEKRKAGSDAKAYRDDGLCRTLAALIYEDLGEKDDALISWYQAVKAYQEAKQPVPPDLARYAYAVLSANGREDDVKELGLTASAAPADSLGGSEIVVVGELGRAPTLGENVFWGTWVRDGLLVYHYQDANGREITQALPAPGLPPQAYQQGRRSRNQHTASGTTFHVKWSMPALKEVPSLSRHLRVALGGATYSGQSFADTRDLLQQDLDENYSATLIRTVTRVVIRTVAEQETKSALNSGNPLLNLLVNVGADMLSDQLEHADTRAWFLLPRTLQIVRIPVKPGHYTLTVGADAGNGRTLRSETRDVEIKAGQKKFVYFTSLR